MSTEKIRREVIKYGLGTGFPAIALLIYIFVLPTLWAAPNVSVELPRTAPLGRDLDFELKLFSARTKNLPLKEVKSGADFIKAFATGGNTTPNTNSDEAQYTQAEMCALTQEVRRLNRRVAAHANGAEGVRNAIAAQVTTIEHCSFLHPSGIVYEPDQARIIADEGLYVCPTIFQGRGKVLDLEMASESQEETDFYAKRHQRFDRVRRLLDDGVQMVSGSDAGVTHNTFDDYPSDLMLMAEGVDLAPLYVLKTATSVAANALGRPDLGVIDAGKSADLLAVQGNPLQDIRVLRQTQFVMARGQIMGLPTASGAPHHASSQALFSICRNSL